MLPRLLLYTNLYLEPTIHSRAARRAVSPSIDIDKSIKTTRRDSADHSIVKPHVLAAQNAGITKKSKSKPIKRQQRLRRLKGVEKAESAVDKLEVKVQKSVGREKKVRERRKGWEEVNVTGKRKGEGKKLGGNAFEALDEERSGWRNGEREWVSDEEMPELDVNVGAEEDGNVMASEVSGEVREIILPQTIPLPVATAEEDEML